MTSLIRRSYTVLPFEDIYVDDVYGNQRGDHYDQFSLPFLHECADIIDHARESGKDVSIHLSIKSGERLLFQTYTTPSDDNYLGDFDDELDRLLWMYRNISIKTDIEVFAKSNDVPSN